MVSAKSPEAYLRPVVRNKISEPSSGALLIPSRNLVRKRVAGLAISQISSLRHDQHISCSHPPLDIDVLHTTHTPAVNLNSEIHYDFESQYYTYRRLPLATLPLHSSLRVFSLL